MLYKHYRIAGISIIPEILQMQQQLNKDQVS